METLETLQSHALRVLARHMRASAGLTKDSWYANKMVDSAIDLEVQADSLEAGSQVFMSLPNLLVLRQSIEHRQVKLNVPTNNFADCCQLHFPC